VSIAFLLLLVPLAGLADTELAPIAVEAEKDVVRFTFTPTETVTPVQLEHQPIGLLSPELEKVPGLVANQNGGPGGRVSFFLRGTESRHVSFTLDGLKINDASNTDRQFDAAFVTAPFLREVMVHKGPQAVLFGSDALGGVIELTTRRGEHAPETRLQVNAGSFGTIGSTLAKDWKSEAGNGTLTATRFHTDGISRLNEKRHDADERDATDVTQLTSSSEHRWGGTLQTDLLATYLHGRAEQDGFADDNDHDYSRNDQYALQQKTNFALSEHQAISLRNGLNRHQRMNESLAAGEEVFSGNLLQHELVHRLEAGPWGVLSGLATEHESARARRLDRSFDLHSAFLQSSYRRGPFRLHAGGRLERHSRYGTFETGAAGVGWEDLSFQYSQGYKAPSLYQLYGPPLGGLPVGNPALEPETNHSLEASWKKTAEAFDAGVSVFQNRLANLFTFDFGRGYFNQQRFIAEGIELSGKLRTGPAEVSSSFTHQQFRRAEEPVLRRPNNILHVGVSVFPEDTLELNVSGRWFSARRDFGGKLNPYEVVNLGIRKNWARDDVSLQLRNVLNREYEELYGFSVLPRSLFVGYGHRF
jgi:vitamin B12 transporter